MSITVKRSVVPLPSRESYMVRCLLALIFLMPLCAPTWAHSYPPTSSLRAPNSAEEAVPLIDESHGNHPSFRRILGVVWQNQIPDDVWNRLKAIAPPSW